MDRLYDASAFFNLLPQGTTQDHDFAGQAVLDLTKYELGSVILRKSDEVGKDGMLRLFYMCINLAADMHVLDMRGMELDVAAMGVSTGLTFYDSAYVVGARQYGLELVTDDGDMLAAARSNGIAAAKSDEV